MGKLSGAYDPMETSFAMKFRKLKEISAGIKPDPPHPVILTKKDKTQYPPKIGELQWAGLIIWLDKYAEWHRKYGKSNYRN